MPLRAENMQLRWGTASLQPSSLLTYSAILSARPSTAFRNSRMSTSTSPAQLLQYKEIDIVLNQLAFVDNRQAT